MKADEPRNTSVRQDPLLMKCGVAVNIVQLNASRSQLTLLTAGASKAKHQRDETGH